MLYLVCFHLPLTLKKDWIGNWQAEWNESLIAKTEDRWVRMRVRGAKVGVGVRVGDGALANSRKLLSSRRVGCEGEVSYGALLCGSAFSTGSLRLD